MYTEKQEMYASWSPILITLIAISKYFSIVKNKHKTLEFFKMLHKMFWVTENLIKHATKAANLLNFN